MITVQTVLGLPPVRRALPEVVAGQENLLREIRWSHVLDLATAGGLLGGGEFVLANGVGLGAGASIQRAFVRDLDEQQAAALAVELGLQFKRELPGPLVDEARERGMPLIALHRKSRFVELTEAIHNELTSHQYPLLRAADELSQRLNDMMLRGLGTHELLRELSRTMRNPIVLEDSSHQLVAYGTHESGEAVVLRTWADHSDAERRDGELGRGSFAAPVRLLDRAWGRLVLLELDSQITAVDRDLLMRGAAALSLHILTRQREEEVGARSRGALLSDLVADRVSDEDAAQRAVALGFPRRHGLLVPLAARWRATALDARPPSATPDWTRLVPDLKYAFGSAALEALIGPRESDLLLIVNVGDGPISEELLERLAQVFHQGLSRFGVPAEQAALAIGPAQESWRTLGHALGRAGVAAGAATAEPPRTWYDARKITVVELLYSMRQSQDLAAFVTDQLGPLIEPGGDRRRAELLKTLEAYLEHGGRKAHAARALHLERQSLYGRLERLEAVLGLSLEDGDTLLALHLAVRALNQLRNMPPNLIDPT